MKPKFIFFILFFVMGLFFLCSETGFTSEKKVYIIKISGIINPGVAEFVEQGITKGIENDAACLIIMLDTPGGLADSMRKIVMDILNSRAPVVVYIAPSGARAASAGVMITIAADIAAMAPGTNIGAAHPVGIAGKEIDKTISEKITNDIVAHAKSIARQRHRNEIWVEKAIRESISVAETEALQENVIDIIAKDIDDLIKQINGFKLSDNRKLDLDNCRQIILKENIRTKILRIISDPNIAYIFMMIGLAGLYFELSNPGAIFPGVIGAISLILAFFSFQTLPVNYAGIILIILALIFFIMEIKIASYGLLSIAGVISFFLGSLMLFEGNPPELKVSMQVLVPTMLMVSGFFVIVASLVFKAQIVRPKTGAKGLIGEIGVVTKTIDPEGKVFVHGELWFAISEKMILKDANVRVIKVENLVLEVEPV